MKKQLIPTITIFFLLVALGWYLDRIAHTQIVGIVGEVITVVRFLIYALTSLGLLTLTVIVVFFVLSVREKMLTRQANRKIIEREADVYAIVNDAHGVFVREMNPKAVWRPLHLNPTPYQNGQQLEISPMELAAWQTWTLRNRPNAIKEAGLPLLSAQAQVDLLTTLDTVQRCLIVGASDSGKTTLLQHLVNRRLHTSKVIVIDPHAYPQKWPGCMVIGTGRNYADIDRALTALVQLMTKRYDDIGKGTVIEGHHPRLTILIDEWRAIIYNVKGASEAIKALLTESRKAAMSVFVATHSDRAKPLGLAGEYDLKDGFAIVRLSIVNGQRQATLDMGSGEVVAQLPGAYVNGGQTITVDSEVIDLEVKPTPIEARILELYEQGESYNEIARQVFGHTGGKQTQQIKDVLEKFNQN